MKSIVIFGGAGFIGKHLIRRLTKNGHKIIVPYQRSVQEAKIRLLGVTGQVIPFRYSSLEDKRLKSVLNNADVCINLKTTYDQKKGDFKNTIWVFPVLQSGYESKISEPEGYFCRGYNY